MPTANSRHSGEYKPVTPAPHEDSEEPDVSGEAEMKSEIARGLVARLKNASFEQLCLFGILAVLTYASGLVMPWAANKILELRAEERAEAKKALEAAVKDGKDDTSTAKAEAKLALEQYQVTHEKDQIRLVESFKASHADIADAVREQSESIKDMSRDVKSLTETMRDYVKQQQPPRSP